jgi:hypothetical protein
MTLWAEVRYAIFGHSFDNIKRPFLLTMLSAQQFNPREPFCHKASISPGMRCCVLG